jgi:uncharacterized protein YigA (DUF484 family)
MLKDLLLENGFTEDQIKTIISNINSSQDYVPKATFNAELEKVRNLKADILNRDDQLKALNDKVGDNENLQKEIKRLQDENTKAKKDYNDNIKRMQKDIAIASKYGDSVYNIDDIKRNFNYDKITLNEKGEIIDGFEAQDIAIREKYPHYFKTQTTNTISIDGVNASAGSNPSKPILSDAELNAQAGIDLVKALRGIKD